MEIRGYINEEYVRTVIKKRDSDIHKGDCGRVLIVAGKRGMAGAAVLAGKAAIKSGSGLVFAATLKKNFHILQIAVPEVICTTWRRAKKDLSTYDAVAVGPGMGVKRRTKKIIKYILINYKKTVVIDADGLNTISKYAELQDLLRKTEADVIITPHQGESERLLGENLKGKTREDIGQKLVDRYNCISVVKGPGTLVVLPCGEAYVNTTGNPGMATAGSGDVLTGLTVSFAGQGFGAENAAKTGVCIHGLAGDMAAEKFGEYGMTSGNIADCLPFAIKDAVKQN